MILNMSSLAKSDCDFFQLKEMHLSYGERNHTGAVILC